MTIALSNYCLKENSREADDKWRVTITYGTGKGFKLQEINIQNQSQIEKIINNLEKGNLFIEKVNNGFSEKIASAKDLQDMYEKNYSNGKSHPLDLIEDVKKLVNKYANDELIKPKENIFEHKESIHEKQLFSLYALNQINKIANGGQ